MSDVLVETVLHPTVVETVTDVFDSHLQVQATAIEVVITPLQVAHTFPGPRGERGPPGAGGGSSFEYTQVVPALVWNITHNLGYRPVIQLHTTGGIRFSGYIHHLSTSTLQVTLNVAIAGTARLL